MEDASVIASLYRKIEEIGSGGLGTVFLGEHLRLNKKVVLKASAGSLSRKPERLRREVDALKDLNHSGIPQVYDIVEVEEEGIVYTVMDFIDGESLDHPLRRNERFSQAQIVEWSIQLLEAIDYLHSRPPYGILHADIKPANVMLTPEGDVRLIDFNIALVMGEEGAVKVGSSRGYSSPEHYGYGQGSGEATQQTSPQQANTQQPSTSGSSKLSGGDTQLEAAVSDGTMLDAAEQDPATPEDTAHGATELDATELDATVIDERVEDAYAQSAVVSDAMAVDATMQGATETDATQADASELDGTVLDATEADATEIDATELDATELDATVSDATEIDVTELDATELDATELDVTELDATELDATELDKQLGADSSSNPSALGDNAKRLDARSDIYMLGATLYHLVTGERPADDATKVKPISNSEYSPTVIAIIEKAMNPDQDSRWQSAKEMLEAFLHLRDADPRTRKYKRTVFMTTAALIALFLAGGITVFAGQRLMEREQRQIAEEARLMEEEQRQIALEQSRLARLNEAYALAEYSANALRDGDMDAAIDYALQAHSSAVIAEAQKALTDALNIYDLSDGFKAHRTVELPSAPLQLAISPGGSTAAAIYAFAAAVFDTDTAEILATLPVEQSALSEVRFLDDNTIIYAAEGGIKAYDIANKLELWAGKPATSISISADGRSVAAVYRNESHAIVYDAITGQIIKEVGFDGKQQRVAVNDIFANPNYNLFVLNYDGTLLGISFSDGSLWVYDLRDSSGDIELFDESSGFTRFEGGFHERYFAFSASSSSASLFAVIDTVELVQTVGFRSGSHFAVKSDASGIFVQTGNILVKIQPETGDQTSLITTFEKVLCFALSESHALITTQDEFMFFDAYANLLLRHEKGYGSDFLQIAADTALIGSLDAPVIRIMKYEGHPQAELFSYDPSYVHDEARISPEDRTVVLFSFVGFRVYDMSGNLIAEVPIPDADYLHDQQFIRGESGSYLEVTYNDGTKRAYSAVDGTVLYETVGEKPDMTLFEVFYTDSLRIEAPLHGTVLAYNLETGEFICELEKDAYLTYVTQIGEHVLTEYVTGDGFRYGLLLNNQCETLAYLPYLSDYSSGRLIFNYPTGNLRESRIYDMNELLALARS